MIFLILLNLFFQDFFNNIDDIVIFFFSDECRIFQSCINCCVISKNKIQLCYIVNILKRKNLLIGKNNL